MAKHYRPYEYTTADVDLLRPRIYHHSLRSFEAQLVDLAEKSDVVLFAFRTIAGSAVHHRKVSRFNEQNLSIEMLDYLMSEYLERFEAQSGSFVGQHTSKPAALRRYEEFIFGYVRWLKLPCDEAAVKTYLRLHESFVNAIADYLWMYWSILAQSTRVMMIGKTHVSNGVPEFDPDALVRATANLYSIPKRFPEWPEYMKMLKVLALEH